MALILDGTDGITSSGGTNVLQDDAVITANIADGAVNDAKIAAMAAVKLTGRVPAANVNLGGVLQVVQGIKTDTSSFTSSSGSFGVSGLNVSITPTSASSKFLVIYNAYIGSTAGQRNGTLLQRNIGGGVYSEIFRGNAEGSRLRGTTSSSPHGGNVITTHSASHVDSPNTTSVLNYRVLMNAEGNNAVHMNRSGNDDDSNTVYRTASSIIVMEIAA